jgi:hypothetical protein
MSTMAITEVYEHLDANLGKDTAKKLTTFIVNQIDDKFENNMSTLVKQDKLSEVVLALREDFAKFSFSMKEDFSNLEVRLENKINDFKIDIIRWMFAFWATVILMFIGLYLKS